MAFSRVCDVCKARGMQTFAVAHRKWTKGIRVDVCRSCEDEVYQLRHWQSWMMEAWLHYGAPPGMDFAGGSPQAPLGETPPSAPPLLNESQKSQQKLLPGAKTEIVQVQRKGFWSQLTEKFKANLPNKQP
jgi:hypothetical protein